MNNSELLALVAVVIQAVLALLFAFVWRALRVRWALLLTVSFAVLAALYVALASGRYRVALNEQSLTSNVVLVVVALILISAGLLDYVGLGRRRSRWLNSLSAAVGVLIAVGASAGALTRGVALSLLCTYLLGWALLFAWAMAHEPRRGHGLVLLAMLAYPAMLAAALLGFVRPELLNTASVFPFSVLGMTLLCTGLLRTQQRVKEELAARERAESELRITNETLEHRVNLRTAELREVIEGLESFNRSVSHDLRGPLGGIAGVAKLARNYVASGNRSAAERMLSAIEAQAETSTKLVAALLALARAGDAQLRLQRLDTGVLVREAIESIRQSQEVAALSIKVAALPELEGDAELVRQVFVNLLSNALKFSATASRPQVEVGVMGGAPDRPTFFVRDNGAGFSAEDAKRLFKPFQRLHGARYEGFGVGLSIVKRIVDRHGGEVWAEGEPGSGATFFFNFGRPVAIDPSP